MKNLPFLRVRRTARKLDHASPMDDSAESINSAGSARNNLALAALLLTDAEDIARSPGSRSIYDHSLLCDIAKALAATDPDRAEHIARSITGAPSSQAAALSDIAKALAATEPDRAAQLLTDAEELARSTTWKNSDLVGIAEAVAAIDPDRAERIARSIADKSYQAKALIGIAKALAAASS